ncbi:MAG: helix-turn-helix transcriptional regulator [Acidimicrobiales bacterium]
MSTPVSPRLHAEAVRRRRAELGLSAREVADAVGMPSLTYHALERGHGTETMELRKLVRLSQALALSLDELVEPGVGSSAVESTKPATGTVDEDAAALGVLLFATGTLTPAGAICEALGWDLARLHDAEQHLSERLGACGLRLHRLTSRLGVARADDAVDREVLKQAVRRQLGREQVSLSEARMVRRIQQGRAPATPSNAERVTYGVLVNAGLVDFEPGRNRNNEAAMVLSEDVRFSLMI